jgi:hypothetical protein
MVASRAPSVGEKTSMLPLAGRVELDPLAVDVKHREPAMRRRPSRMSLPAALAGSAFGPMTTKSLYMTSWRLTPKPSAMNFSSAALSCTKTTSASPRRAMSSAWPVPSATTRTLMPLAFSKAGSRWPKRPDCSVEVVDDTVMKRSWAWLPTGSANAPAASAEQNRRRVIMVFPP